MHTQKSDSARGVISIVDQMVVSGTNFLSIVAVGRTSGLDSLALYSLGFSVLVLVATSVRSLVVTPYMVLAKQRELPQQQAMRCCVLIAWGVCAMISIIAALAWILVAPVQSNATNPPGSFVLLVILAVPCWMLREIARQICMSDLRFVTALVLDVITSATQLAAIAYCYFQSNAVSESMAMGVVLATSLGAGLVWLLSTGQSFPRRSAVLSQVMGELWKFGRWGAVSQASHVAQGYAVHWILLLTSGLQAAGVYAAAASIVQLANPIINGAGNALIPLFSARRGEHGPESLRRAVTKISPIALVAGVAFVGMTLALGVQIAMMVYGDRFAISRQLIVSLSVVVAINAIVLPATKVISVLEFPQVNCALNLGTFALTAVLGTLGSMVSGLEGAAIGLLCAAGVGGCAKWIAYRRIIHNSMSSEHQQP